MAKYLKKGQRAYVEGRLEIDRWVNRDGKDQVTLKVIANDVRAWVVAVKVVTTIKVVIPAVIQVAVLRKTIMRNNPQHK